ncbi:MAG: DUF1993 domain-containing protein [Burkholderiales bacterium]|nr:DUF1993 domain-containing protein [Burkholderiales bacterium]
MPLTMYAASAPRFVHMLNNLAALLDKAQAHIDAKKLDPAALTASRLFPDMYPLTRQVQIACDVAKGAVGRLGGAEVPRHEDSEQTIPELKARIAKTIAFINSVKPEPIDASADRNITVKLGRQEYTFTGMQYLLNYAHPNFYFHITTAYNILRHNGVEIGKKDFNGAF